jgi:hypothetical protein
MTAFMARNDPDGSGTAGHALMKDGNSRKRAQRARLEGSRFDCLKLKTFYWGIGFARLSVCWQTAPENAS